MNIQYTQALGGSATSQRKTSVSNTKRVPSSRQTPSNALLTTALVTNHALDYANPKNPISGYTSATTRNANNENSYFSKPNVPIKSNNCSSLISRIANNVNTNTKVPQTPTRSTRQTTPTATNVSGNILRKEKPKILTQNKNILNQTAQIKETSRKQSSTPKSQLSAKKSNSQQHQQLLLHQTYQNLTKLTQQIQQQTTAAHATTRSRPISSTTTNQKNIPFRVQKPAQTNSGYGTIMTKKKQELQVSSSQTSLLKKASQPKLVSEATQYSTVIAPSAQTLNSSDPVQQTHQTVQEATQRVTEYRLYMEKQKQILKKMSSNKQIQKAAELPKTQQESPKFKEFTKNDQMSTTANQCSFGESAKVLPPQQLYKPIPVLTKTIEPTFKAIETPQETGFTPRVLSSRKTTPLATAEPLAQKPAEKAEPDPEDSMVFSNKAVLDDYIIGKQIGQGAYAVVRVGLHKPTNKKVAMKIYKKYKLMDPNRRKSVRREIKLMEKMRSQHIIRLYEVIDTGKYVIIVMEYVAGGSLHGYLKAQSNKRLAENEAKRVFKQVVEGIRYCHNRCITHRDIKLENLLLDEQNNVKIIDFGFSTCIPNDRKVKIFCGTPSYMAPEIVNKTEYCGPPADIWALGVLLFTMLCGCFPYRGATDEELYGKISNAEYKVPADVYSSLTAEAVDLLASLFTINGEKRISAKEILNHAWLVDVPLPQQQPIAPQIVRAQSIQPQKTQETALVKTNSDNYQTSAVCSSKQQQLLYKSQPSYNNPQSLNNPHTLKNSTSGTLDNQNIMSGGNVINNNFNIINNFMGVQDGTGNHTQDYPAQKLYFKPANNWMHDELNEKIVQNIVTKLGYSESEVRNYVLHDQNSFVGVLYQKLFDDQLEKTEMIKRNLMFKASTISTSSHDISAKLPIQPSFVPSIGSLNHFGPSSTGYVGGGMLMQSMSKLSLNQTNTFEKSREQLNLNQNLSGTLNFYTQQQQDNSPNNGIKLNKTHDVTASLLSGSNCNSSNYLRRGENQLQLVNSNLQTSEPLNYMPQTQTHQRMAQFEMPRENSQSNLNQHSKENIKQSQYSPMLFRRQNAEANAQENGANYASNTLNLLGKNLQQRHQ